MLSLALCIEGMKQRGPYVCRLDVVRPVRASRLESVVGLRLSKFAGEFTARVPPVPIPNTEVKPRRADGTARASVWEIR